jgi:enterochelin esterase family protein
VTALTTGSEAWWQSKNGPEWVREQESYRVTFWWRDPAGTQKSSAVKRVWLYITGVTDHHQNACPQSLNAFPIPTSGSGRVSSARGGAAATVLSLPGMNMILPMRSFTVSSPTAWRCAKAGAGCCHAVSDPLNPQSWRGGRGHAVSALEMPEAPVQPGWNRPDAPYSPPACIEWNSERLGNRRRVWIFTTGDANPERPLAVLLDGQFWAESMPVWPALAALTARQTAAGGLCLNRCDRYRAPQPRAAL